MTWIEESETYPRECLKFTCGTMCSPVNRYYEAVLRFYEPTEVEVRIESNFEEKSKEVFHDLGTAVFYALNSLNSLSKG